MKILDLFKVSKEEREEKKVERLGRALKRGQEKLIDDLDDKRDALQKKKDDLESLSVDKVNEDTWNKEYHQAIVDLKMIDKEIEIAKETMSQLFTDEEK